ncbi:MAG TPA: hypothetical protein VMC62_02165 [Longilinea sp.]|nr:hypothetical protein [Longilinea sp.]
MLDDLRNTANNPPDAETPVSVPPVAEMPMEEEKHFLGMTAPQRFVIVLMLLMMVCVVGVFFLMITGSINLPIF